MIDPTRLAEYARLARRLAGERAAAQAVVADVRRMPSAYVREPVPDGWRTMGVVDALCDAARELLARAPDKSEALAEYATAIVGASRRELSAPASRADRGTGMEGIGQRLSISQ